MINNNTLARLINDASWNKFINMLEYKAEWYGVNIFKIGRFDPSSKICSNCGDINHNLKLSERTWICKKCNALHDRDVNAAINIKKIALKKTVCGTHTEDHKELPTLVGALTCEI